MKIDQTKFKKSQPPASLGADLRELIETADDMSESQFLSHLKANLQWKAPKMELMVWVSVVDRVDGILEECLGTAGRPWALAVDSDAALQAKLRLVLAFIHELFENTTSRTCFASFERLIALLDSARMDLVRSVLSVIQTISRRTQLMAKLSEEQRTRLVEVLEGLATPWERPSLPVAQWAQMPATDVPAAARSLTFHFSQPSSSAAAASANVTKTIRIDDVPKKGKTAGELMGELGKRLGSASAPERRLHAALRLANSLHTPPLIAVSLIARLQALQILLYAGVVDEAKLAVLLPSSLVIELVAVLKLTTASQRELQCETFRTLIAIIHYDRTNMLELLIDELSVGEFHGFLPTMVRERLGAMMGGSGGEEENLTTAMMSFVYHLSNYEPGREALVQSGLLQSLVAMVRWEDARPPQMQFVTRSVRLIDIMLHSIHLPTFTTLRGFPAILRRLELEVDKCRLEEPYVMGHVAELGKEPEPLPDPPSTDKPNNSAHVLPKRAALIKSLQNFLKRVIATPNMATLTNQMMNSSLPRSLAHIISNQSFYGPALFLQSIEVVTLFIQSQPSELSGLQDRGLIAIIETAILEREIPANREFLCKLFSIFTALSTNERGLKGCLDKKLFDKAFSVLSSTKYLSALKRGRRSEAMVGGGDTVTDLGAACDDLIKHHPQLRTQAIDGVVGLFTHVVELGTSPKYSAVAKHSASATEPEPAAGRSEENSGSEEEMETEELGSARSKDSSPESTPVPLPDFLNNLLKFTDSFIGSSPHHHHIPNSRVCEEFFQKGGVKLLTSCLTLPNLSYEMEAATRCLSPLTKLIVNLATFSRENGNLTTSLIEGMVLVAGKVGEVTSGEPSEWMDRMQSQDASAIRTNLFYLSNYLSCIVKILATQSTLQRQPTNLKPWLKPTPALPQLAALHQQLESWPENSSASDPTRFASDLQMVGRLKGLLKDFLLGLARLGQPSTPREELQAQRRMRDLDVRSQGTDSTVILHKLWASLTLPVGSEGPLKAAPLSSQLRLYSQLLFGESGSGRLGAPTLRAVHDSGALASLFRGLERAAREREAAEDAAVEALESFVETGLGLVLKLVDPAVVLSSAAARGADYDQPFPTSRPPDRNQEASLNFLKSAQSQAIEASASLSQRLDMWRAGSIVKLTMSIWSRILDSSSVVSRADEELEKARNPERAKERAAEETAALEAMVEPADLAALIDMGFDRPTALNALAQHGSVEAAAEFLLSRGSAALASRLAPALVSDEEEEIRRAIQLSMTPADELPPAAPVADVVPSHAAASDEPSGDEGHPPAAPPAEPPAAVAAESDPTAQDDLD